MTRRSSVDIVSRFVGRASVGTIAKVTWPSQDFCPASTTEVEIAASPREVWGLLVDFEGYAQWNAWLPELHGEIFREVNLRKNRLDTPESIEAFFVAHGVPKADFKKAFASFAVDSRVNRAVDLNRRYRISSTPTFVVNGRYVTDAGMAGSEDKLFEIINALAARDKPAS